MRSDGLYLVADCVVYVEMDGESDVVTGRDLDQVTDCDASSEDYEEKEVSVTTY